MKALAIASLLALSVGFGVSGAHAQNSEASDLEDALRTFGMSAPRVPRAAPAFDLERLGSDERIRLEDLAGRVVLLHFWATWCAPCREELAALEDFARGYDASALTVVLVNVDRGSRSVVEDYVASAGLEQAVGLDASGEVRRAYLVEAFPTTYLIDRDGLLAARATGALAWGDDTARAVLERLLEAR